MKNLFTVALLLFSLNCLGQANYDISLLDSINNTTYNQGVFGLTAVEHGGVIHLSYFYGSDDANWSLIHEARNNGQLLSREVAHDFSSNSIDRSSKTAIQFDENGQVFIYCAYHVPDQTKLSVFTKTDQWTYIDLDYTPYVYYVHSSENGQDQPGFVTQYRYFDPGISHNVYDIDYFEFNDGLWTQETIFSSPYAKTNPTCFHAADGDTYISFIEGHEPDTTELYIFKKDQNEWVLDHHAVYENQVPFFGELAGYVAGINYNYFGEYEGNVHLIHNMDNQEGIVSQLTHLVKTASGWEQMDILNPGDYPGNQRFNGYELEFDSKGTLYWVDNAAAVRLILQSQEYRAFNVPLEGAGIGYWDYVIIDDELTVYYFTGDNAYPWGDDLKFFEASTDLNELFSGVHGIDNSIIDAKIFPNPGNGKYNVLINTKKRSEAEFEWLDVAGRSLSASSKYVLSTGNQIIRINTDFQSSGLHFMKIQCKGEKPVLIPVIEK